MKFHYRLVDRLKNKYRKLKQAQSHRSFQETNQSSHKVPARNRNTSKNKNDKELAEVFKDKIREVDTLLGQMREEADNKKKVNLILKKRFLNNIRAIFTRKIRCELSV